MPFRKNRITFASPDSGWLRRVFIEDWGLKLLALAITLVLWFVVSGREIERELVVEPRLEGRPAAAFEVKEVTATPGRIRVSGPASHVNGLEKVETAPISLDGRRETFDVPHTPIYVPDPKVGVVGTVNVHVTIAATDNSGKSRGTD
jgi:YbbR-like protein